MPGVEMVIIALVALLASGLTFFSGFGLGTLLLPAFALFFPAGQAVAMTAVVHGLNGLFKLVLIGRRADGRVLLRFGLPALAAAAAGAALLVLLSGMEPLFSYTLFGRECSVMPIELVIGLLLLMFVAAEVLPRFRERSFDPSWMPLGGLLSGFFGGLSGMQGALRSAFLARAGLSREAFIATGVVIACIIDAVRIGIYGGGLLGRIGPGNYDLLAVAVLAAFTGAVIGNLYLKKLTMRHIRRIVAGLLFAVAGGLLTGLL